MDVVPRARRVAPGRAGRRGRSPRSLRLCDRQHHVPPAKRPGAHETASATIALSSFLRARSIGGDSSCAEPLERAADVVWGMEDQRLDHTLNAPIGTQQDAHGQDRR